MLKVKITGIDWLIEDEFGLEPETEEEYAKAVQDLRLPDSEELELQDDEEEAADELAINWLGAKYGFLVKGSSIQVERA